MSATWPLGRFFLLLLVLLPIHCWAFDYLQALPTESLVPDENPQTPAKVLLGKKLFFDKALLGPGSGISCNSCHNLDAGGDDGRAYSAGQNNRLTRRSSPGLWNIGIQTVLYWDGRSRTLEEQVLDHLRDPVITNWTDIGSIILWLDSSSEYTKAFNAAFPGEAISATNMARAIASFQRTLLAHNSPFDRYLAGNKDSLNELAKKGINSFNEAGCLACHFGANFSGPAPGPALGIGDGFYELFPNLLGTEYEKKYGLSEDLGKFSNSGNPDEKYMWRVPPLRNIELTAPYFHNGSVNSLEEAVKVMAKTQFDKDLSEQTIKEIVAFLKSLTGEKPSIIDQ